MLDALDHPHMVPQELVPDSLKFSWGIGKPYDDDRPVRTYSADQMNEGYIERVMISRYPTKARIRLQADIIPCSKPLWRRQGRQLESRRRLDREAKLRHVRTKIVQVRTLMLDPVAKFGVTGNAASPTAGHQQPVPVRLDQVWEVGDDDGFVRMSSGVVPGGSDEA